jgi:hypothetical protein
VELIEYKKVMDDMDFIIWTDESTDTLGTQIYIENKIIDELEQNSVIQINVALGEVKGEKIGFLFMKT